MKIRMEVVGVKAFRGSIDGKLIDSGTVFCKVRMDERQNEVQRGSGEVNFKAGEATEEWKLPDSGHALKLKGRSLPCMVELDVERLSNGRETKEVVIGMELVEAPVLRKAA